MQSDPPLVSGDLAVPCEELPLPASNDFADILESCMLSAEQYYNMCDNRQKLIDIINAR